MLTFMDSDVDQSFGELGMGLLYQDNSNTVTEAVNHRKTNLTSKVFPELPWCSLNCSIVQEIPPT